MKLDIDNHQSTITHLEQKLSDSETLCNELQQSNKDLLKQQSAVQKEQEEKIFALQQANDEEIERLQIQQKVEVEDIQAKNEKSLAQLKTL